MGSILEEAAQGRATIVPWTVDRYHRAIASGLLVEDAALELIDGFIVRKDRAKAGGDPMTVGDRHRVAVLRLARLAPALEPLGCFLQTQQPIALPPLNEPEPDAAVIRGRIDDYLERPPSAPEVTGVVEVSDSSLSRDLGSEACRLCPRRNPAIHRGRSRPRPRIGAHAASWRGVHRDQHPRFRRHAATDDRHGWCLCDRRPSVAITEAVRGWSRALF